MSFTWKIKNKLCTIAAQLGTKKRRLWTKAKFIRTMDVSAFSETYAMARLENVLEVRVRRHFVGNNSSVQYKTGH